MTRRRGSGEDSIYRDGDRWRGAVSLGYDEHGNRLRKKVSGRTRAEVTEKLRKLHREVDTGVIPDERLTVQAFLGRWLTVNLPGSVAESTEDDYVDTVRLHLVPAIGRKPLAKLTVADLDRLWKAKRCAAPSGRQCAREWWPGTWPGCRQRRVSGPKTPKSRRTLSLTPELVNRFRAIPGAAG
jgi:hypothetical protein